MAYVITENRLGQTHIGSVDDSAKVPVGTIVTAVDPTLGAGEFIYLLGVVSTVTGSVVTWSVTSHLTALASVGTSIPQPLAVAMGAVVAGKYGWYQISGIAVALKAVAVSLAAGVAVAVATGGATVTATTTLIEVDGALVALVASAKSDVSTVRLVIHRPRMIGRIQ